MVAIEKNNDEVVVRVLGSHRFWAFKSQIRFKANQVAGVGPAEAGLMPPWLRWPGTMVPWVICAGTYYGSGRKEFWDRTRRGAGVRIDLRGGPYTRLVVDVPDAQEAIRLLSPP